MSEQSTISKIFNDVVNAIKVVVDEKFIFLCNRPKVGKGDTSMDKFIVIDFPDVIDDIAIGGRDYLLHTTGVLSLFVKGKKDNTLNVNSTSDFISSVKGCFPISGEYVVGVNPKILLRGSDSYGYQVTDISFDLHTK